MGSSSPSNDEQRSATLRQAAILASGMLLLRGDAVLQERIAKLAERTRTRVSGITVMNDETCWLPICHRIDAESLPLSESLCAAVVKRNSKVTLPNLLKDPEFKDHPAVIGPMRIRAYAGVPLGGILGGAIGTVFVADTEPRDDFDAEVLAQLETEADYITREIQQSHHRHRTEKYAVGPLMEMIRKAMREGDDDLVTALDHVLRSIEPDAAP
ncbi:GAF domain-containing protein [Stakelama sp. CBK3Z-3]|uniref:GAF domain-containing protein n=1 Tax=Stakelama flava TaxID=2860338 RepID=A0ABS6XLZ7_9SPHN|nr:GAF domain-containing protein [Stakelama flava]MBW4330450.1 GAF domain-containing protein [Stakelama flava]